jgi:hypothetical protein
VPRLSTAIRRQHDAGFEVGLTLHLVVDRTEVDVRKAEQLLEAVDDEIGLLEVVDAVARAHHPFELKVEPVRRRVVEREDGLGRRRRDAGAVDPQAVLLLDQAELDRVPVHPRQLVEHAELLRAQAADAVGLDVVGDGRVHQQRHVPEDVVEDVRLLEVVELVRLADEVAGREAPVREVLEEHFVGHQPRHGDDLPSGALHQDVGEAAEVRDPVRGRSAGCPCRRRSRRRHGRAAAGSVARTASSRPRARPRCTGPSPGRWSSRVGRAPARGRWHGRAWPSR